MDLMVALDLSGDPREVLQRALPWAARLTARVHLRAVSRMQWEPDEVFGGTETQALAQEWERRRDAEVKTLRKLAADVPSPMQGEHQVITGSPVPALIHAATGFDLLVVGTHGRQGLERWFMGSVAEHVLRESPVPVLVTPLASEPVLPEGPMRVVCPVDAAAPKLSAVAQVRQWLGPDVDLHLIYALSDLRLSEEIGLSPTIETPDDHPHRRWAEEQLRASLAEINVEAAVHFILSAGNNPAEEIATFAAAWQADAIAMPTHGRTGLTRMFVGSVAERLVRNARCPCLVVPG